jgi:hypothetical protein
MDQETYTKDQLQITFHPTSQEQVVTIALEDKSVQLNATEANNLLEWLYQKRDIFFQYEMVQHLQQKQKG